VGESEAQISRAVMDYLAARHIFAVRMNSGTTVMVSNGKRRAIHMNAPGTADILAFPHYFFRDHTDTKHEEIIPTWLELKTAAGKQSELQASFQRQVEAEGHVYAIIRSVEDVEIALRAILGQQRAF
jgi:hypothetical protein